MASEYITTLPCILALARLSSSLPRRKCEMHLVSDAHQATARSGASASLTPSNHHRFCNRYKKVLLLGLEEGSSLYTLHKYLGHVNV